MHDVWLGTPYTRECKLQDARGWVWRRFGILSVFGQEAKTTPLHPCRVGTLLSSWQAIDGWDGTSSLPALQGRLLYQAGASSLESACFSQQQSFFFKSSTPYTTTVQANLLHPGNSHLIRLLAEAGWPIGASPLWRDKREWRESVPALLKGLWLLQNKGGEKAQEEESLGRGTLASFFWNDAIIE